MDTWMTSHGDCSGGWRWPTGVGKPMVAAHIMATTRPVTNVPTKRRSLRKRNSR